VQGSQEFAADIAGSAHDGNPIAHDESLDLDEKKRNTKRASPDRNKT
jgi:hypothetical protein